MTVQWKRSMLKQVSVRRLAVETVPVDDETNLHNGDSGRGKRR